MSYKMSIKKESDFLHINVTGVQSRETVTAIAWDVLEACEENEVSKVLVDVREMTGRLVGLDAYEVSALEFPKLQEKGILKRAAVIDLEENSENSRFFETVAVNRGINIRIFSSADEAVDWLDKE